MFSNNNSNSSSSIVAACGGAVTANRLTEILDICVHIYIYICALSPEEYGQSPH